ncbi:MAG: pantetheine-phosphate adenylyltransferase [Bdellovibrionaceae bacterium]|nr:pantetheine-phosphate adenylyltransferase [Pseudobdellovibrionaceae bacterium]
MTSVRRAVYPGSFDPIHLGHLDIIHRIAKVFDEVIVLIAVAPDKGSLFSIDERKELLRRSLTDLKNVKVESHEGLTVDYMRTQDASVIIRGLRAVMDFEYETSMANMNKKLSPEIETLLVFSKPEFYYVSSRGVKEVVRNKGSVHGLVPDAVETALKAKFGTR